MTEYAVLIGTVAIGSSVAFVAVGVAFVRNFADVRTILLASFP